MAAGMCWNYNFSFLVLLVSWRFEIKRKISSIYFDFFLKHWGAIGKIKKSLSLYYKVQLYYIIKLLLNTASPTFIPRGFTRARLEGRLTLVQWSFPASRALQLAASPTRPLLCWFLFSLSSFINLASIGVLLITLSCCVEHRSQPLTVLLRAEKVKKKKRQREFLHL